MEHTLEPLGFEIEDQPLCLIGLCHMLCLLLHNHSYTYHITCFPLRSSALVQFPYPHLTSPNPTTRSRAVPINSTSRDGVLGSTLRRHPPHLYHKLLTHIPLMESSPSPPLILYRAVPLHLNDRGYRVLQVQSCLHKLRTIRRPSRHLILGTLPTLQNESPLAPLPLPTTFTDQFSTHHHH